MEKGVWSLTDRATKRLVKLLPTQFQHSTLRSKTALEGVEHETVI